MSVVQCSPSHGLNCTKTSHLKACVYKSSDHIGINSSVIVILMIELGSSIFISGMPAALVRMYVHRNSQQYCVLYGEEMKFFAEKLSPSIHDIVMKATKNLNDRYIIGRGAHGFVYKIQHPQLTCVAKKIVFGGHNKGFSSMHENSQAFLMIRHRNLVSYKACLFGEDHGLILCDYMENGSLHDILHEKDPPPPLTWNVRFNIAVGIARGLRYLHHLIHFRHPHIVHGDIKAKNILMDANMDPHISDFGTVVHSVHTVGTVGYIAPGN